MPASTARPTLSIQRSTGGRGAARCLPRPAGSVARIPWARPPHHRPAPRRHGAVPTVPPPLVRRSLDARCERAGDGRRGLHCVALRPPCSTARGKRVTIVDDLSRGSIETVCPNHRTRGRAAAQPVRMDVNESTSPPAPAGSQHRGGSALLGDAYVGSRCCTRRRTIRTSPPPLSQSSALMNRVGIGRLIFLILPMLKRAQSPSPGEARSERLPHSSHADPHTRSRPRLGAGDLADHWTLALTLALTLTLRIITQVRLRPSRSPRRLRSARPTRTGRRSCRPSRRSSPSSAPRSAKALLGGAAALLQRR